MNKFKKIFYPIYLAYFFVSIFFAIQSDLMFKKFGLFNFINFLKYWAIAGLILFIAIIIVENIHIRQLKKEQKKLDAEKNDLKAKMYDLQNPKEQKKEEAPKPDVEEKASAVQSESKRNNP